MTDIDLGISRRAALAVCIALVSFGATAFPTKPITIIVPFGPGSATDVAARDFGKALSEVTRQPVIIDNRAGAEGTLGGQALLNAPADGHVLLMTSSSMTVLDPLMKKQLPYDPSKDFAPVCGIFSNDSTVNVTTSGPYASLAEFIAAAKAQPGKLTFGHASATQRLAGELFAQAAGIKLTSVPYRTTVAGLTDLGGGQIDAFFVDHVSTAPFRQNAKVKALAVAGEKRLRTLPDVPAAREAGVPEYSLQPFTSVYVSAVTPAAIAQQLRQIVAQTMATPAMLEMIDKRAMLALPLCGDALARHMTQETDRMRNVIEKAGIERQ